MKTPFDKLSASFDYQVAFAALGVKRDDFTSSKIECDDRQGVLRITMDPMGDVYLIVDRTKQSTLGQASFRCRTHGGGGHHERTRKALLMLAVAMREDAEEDR
jgi:hypothetical protein